ncbi:Protein of unknown function [Ruegeria halocynthiae]|uniref:VWFA domain-containing protein n=2 Tax=Ruegeria halocynthiae TaxID=985054 RepID=A0A1H2YG29_9RHOB|nr:Protein of unknown function [Ruegeria halocynthiae]
MQRLALMLTVLVLSWAANPSRAQVSVDIELVIAIDTSVSVSDQEFALQLLGVADAMRGPLVQEAITSMPDGLAVTVMEWSYGHLNRPVLPWFHLRTANDSFAFANHVEQVQRNGGGRATAIGEAITRATELLNNNNFAGLFRKIDISGDARNNSGVNPLVPRQIAIDQGITINGLAILTSDRELGTYYSTFVAGGAGSFVMAISSSGSIRNAMRRKLERELQFQLSHTNPDPFVQKARMSFDEDQ